MIKQMSCQDKKYFAIKRILDVIISVVVFLLFGWLYILIAIIVRIKLGSPVLFSQDRPGMDGKVFKLYKFRSMSNERDSSGMLLPDKERLTHFGRILRSTSLDELPEFFNILKGDMSLIGPRPLLVQYTKKYNSFEMKRHEVRPGLTGLAQISGRNELTWKSRFEKDYEYVENMSFALDVRILFLTVKKVFIREGIEYNNHESINDYFNSPDRPQI